MKKLFNSSIFTFILGALLFSFIGIVSAYSISSNNVDFNPSWTKDNGESITNIDEAIEELYKKSNNEIVYGTDYSNSYETIKETNIGFKPKMLVIIITGYNSRFRTYIYSKKGIKTYTKIEKIVSEDTEIADFQITDNGFKWYVKDSSFGPETLRYYAVK